MSASTSTPTPEYKLCLLTTPLLGTRPAPAPQQLREGTRSRRGDENWANAARDSARGGDRPATTHCSGPERGRGGGKAGALEPGAHGSEGGGQGSQEGLRSSGSRSGGAQETPTSASGPREANSVPPAAAHAWLREGSFHPPFSGTCPDQGQVLCGARGAFSQGGQTALPLSPSSAPSGLWHPKGFVFREKVNVQIPNFRRAGTLVLTSPSPPRPAARPRLTPAPQGPRTPSPPQLCSTAAPG